MALEYFHEPAETLPGHVKEEHRAIASLIEELEAAHWYTERMAGTQDDQLRAVLEHNRNEELEHASMLLEWIRRNMPDFAAPIQTYLNTTAPITEIEETASGGTNPEGNAAGGPTAAQDLGIGSMKKGD